MTRKKKINKNDLLFNDHVNYYSCFKMFYIVCFFCNLKTAGVYADMDFKEGELVLKDPMFVGVQHSLNKVCFIFTILFLCSQIKDVCFCPLLSTILCRLIVWSVVSAFVLLVPLNFK